MKELSYYEEWQLSKYGNILPEVNTPDPRVFESGSEEERRFSEWMQETAEYHMIKEAEYFGCKQDLNL